MRSYLFDQAKAREEVDVRGVLGSLSERQLLWMDAGSAEDAGEVAEALGLRERTVRRIGKPSGRPFLEDFEDYFHLDVAAVRPSGAPVRVDCVVGENWVLTVHDELDLLETFEERVSGAGELGPVGAPSFLATLLDWILASYFDALGQVEVALERLDPRLIKARLPREDDALLEELVALRTTVAGLRRALAPNRTVLASLARPEFDRISTSESAARFAELVQQIDQTLDVIRSAREMVLGSVNLLIARTGQRTNDVMKILTLASIMLLPSSLLAGVLGMNFEQEFFGNSKGFWIAIAAMALLSVATLVTARLRRWI